MALILVTGSPDWTDTALITHHLDQVAADLATRDGRGIAVMHAAGPRRRAGDSWASADWHAARHAQARGWLVLDRPMIGCPDRIAGERLVAECLAYRDRWATALACLACPTPCTAAACRRPGQHWGHSVVCCAEAAAAAGIPVRWVLPDGEVVLEDGGA